MEFLIDYGMFLAKAITIVVSIGVVVGLIASAGQKNKKGEKKGNIRVTQINEHIDGLRDTLRASILNKEQLKKSFKEIWQYVITPPEQEIMEALGNELDNYDIDINYLDKAVLTNFVNVLEAK